MRIHEKACLKKEQEFKTLKLTIMVLGGTGFSTLFSSITSLRFGPRNIASKKELPTEDATSEAESLFPNTN